MNEATITEARKDAQVSARTQRDFQYYMKAFGYDKDVENLRGKIILDVGAGDSNFAQEAEMLGAIVTRIDADYDRRPPSNNNRAITGLMQELPFQNNSFDEVIASHSLFYVVEDKDRLKALSEFMRVVKLNGLIKILPSIMIKNDSSKPLPFGAKVEAVILPFANTMRKNFVLTMCKNSELPSEQLEKDLKNLLKMVRFI